MSFGKRISEDLDVVHSQDPALDGVDSTIMEHYLLTRDTSVLPESALAGATVLRCSPLLVKQEHLATMAHEPPVMREIFRRHVCSARGPGASWLHFETKDGRRQVTEQSAEEAAIDFIAEFVAVIVQAASRRGSAAPFSPPDSWRANRRLTARAKALADLAAAIRQDAPTEEPASEKQ